jgi:hypothetical protein
VGSEAFVRRLAMEIGDLCLHELVSRLLVHRMLPSD